METVYDNFLLFHFDKMVNRLDIFQYSKENSGTSSKKNQVSTVKFRKNIFSHIYTNKNEKVTKSMLFSRTEVCFTVITKLSEIGNRK